ncbi:MAG TPA: hypothetical protein VL178_13435 [Pseudomonas sp.]|nr:hypothetical protein [Pseudomonas sp.]
MALPKPEIDDLEEQRISLVEAYIDTFQLDLVGCKRIERSVQKLFGMPEFECAARITFGLLQSTKRNYGEAVHHLNRAQLLVDSEMVRMASVTAALQCGAVRDAASLLAAAELTSDPRHLRQLMSKAMHAGMYILANKCLEELAKLKADASNPAAGFLSKYSPDIYAAAELVKAHGLCDSDIVERVAVATDVVARRAPDHPFVVYGFSVTPETGIHYEFPLRMPVDELVQLDWDISEALVEVFDDPHSELISFSTRPFSESVRRIA